MPEAGQFSLGSLWEDDHVPSRGAAPPASVNTHRPGHSSASLVSPPSPGTKFPRTSQPQKEESPNRVALLHLGGGEQKSKGTTKSSKILQQRLT